MTSNRCIVCNRKLKIYDHCIKKCSCAKTLCRKHNSPWNHDCTINTKKLLLLKHKKELANKLTKMSQKKVDCI